VLVLTNLLLAEMSTTRGNYIYESKVPEFIQRQIQQLHEQEARIVELEAELNQLRKAHTELESDLAPYRVEARFADITITQRPSLELSEVAPILRCPDEIFCLFFDPLLSLAQDEYFESPHRHPQIRSLLLVCRRWYTLVTNTAKLWARIEASVFDLFDIGSQKSQFPYIFACLNRSKNLPITVYLDMRDLSHYDYITEALAQHAKAIVYEDECDAILEKIRNEDWDFHSTWFDSQLESVFERLIGADAEYIKRWETITLHLPDEADIAIRVWNKLARGLKAVKNVVIKNFPPASPDIFLPDFGTAKSFRTSYADDAAKPPITSFGLSPSTLEHLYIKVGNPSIDLAELSHFQRLRTLRLFCTPFNLSGSPDFSVSLPHLETLNLWGDYNALARLRFDLPSLELLTLSWAVYKPLPAIHPRHMRWFMLGTQDRIELKKTIRDYVLLSNALECITIDSFRRDEVKEVVAQIKLEGKAPLLAQIVVKHINGEVERIRV
jgi:hypothetical protein